MKLTSIKIGQWRIRIGDYRIRYNIEENKVILLRILYREDIYRKWEENNLKISLKIE